jgi:hypothetical protein
MKKGKQIIKPCTWRSSASTPRAALLADGAAQFHARCHCLGTDLLVVRR